MTHCFQKLAIVLILLIAAPQTYAWEMFGDVTFIGYLQARAITRMEDPDGDVNVDLTDAELFEEGVSVATDDDICVITTICVSAAKKLLPTQYCEYCGRGSAAEGLTTLLGVPIPFTTREWGGGGAGETPVCKFCNCPGPIRR